MQMRHVIHLHAARMQGAAVVRPHSIQIAVSVTWWFSSFSIAHAMQLQEAMVEVYWGEDVTSMAPCKTQVSPNGQLVFLG